MIPVYKCSQCGKVFVEWKVGDEVGTPVYFIGRNLAGKDRSVYIRASLVCPSCGSEEGTVVWSARSPMIVFNHGLKAKLMAVHSLDMEEAKEPEVVASKVKELFPDEEVVLWKSGRKVEEETE